MPLRRRFPLILWAVLALSLLLNAVAIGVAWRLNDLRASFNGETEGFRAFSQDVASGVLLSMSDRKEEFRAGLDQLGQARRRMFEAAAARPYDRAAVEQAMADVRAATAELQTRAQNVMLDEFDALAAKGVDISIE